MEQMNKTILGVATLLVILSGTLLVLSFDENDAETVTINGLQYSLSTSTATITGYSSDVPKTDTFNIPSYIITGNKQYDVTAIADFAFMNCTAMTNTVYIPRSITSIGQGCFMGSTLKHFSIEEGSCFKVVSDVLYQNKNLITASPSKSGTVIIEEGTTKVYAYAFYNCTGITDLLVPSDTPEFGSRCFEGCHNMKWIPTFTNKYGTGSGLLNKTVVGEYAFKDCYNLLGKLTINDVPTTSTQFTAIFEEGAFLNCTGLTSIESNRDKLAIKDYCFSGCTNILSIEFKVKQTMVSYLTIDSKAFNSHTFYNDKDELITVSDKTIRNQIFTGESPSHMTYRQYTIHYDPNGGVPDKTDESYGRGYKYTIPTDYSVYKDGCQFKGWDLNGYIYNPGDTITVTKDMNFQAVWKQIIYHDAIFNVNGGTGSVPSITVMEEEKFTLPSYSGTKTGYTFGGWSYNGTTYQPGNSLYMLYYDMVFSAVWNQIDYHSVTFNLNGGTGSVSPLNVAEGATFTLPSYSGTKTGYTFDGWSYNGTTYQPGKVMTMGSFDMTFTASWKENTPTYYTIYFNGNGGISSTSSMQTNAEHKLPSLPTATRDGYSFNGWYTSASGGTKISTSTVFNNNTTVFANWTQTTPTYTITFDPNGGDCNTYSLKTNSDYRLDSLPTATRDGYSFEGWTNNGSTISTNTQFYKDTTVQAKWSSKTIIPGVDNMVLFCGIGIVIIIIIGALMMRRP